MATKLRLQQGQVWKLDEGYLRIVRLERLSVDYKVIAGATNKDGKQHHATKKEFCRLIKKATLVPGAATSPAPEEPQ